MQSLIEKVWLLRADVQTAIVNRNKEKFIKVINTLEFYMIAPSDAISPLLESYNEDKELRVTEVIQQIIQNVKNLREYRFGNKAVNYNFGVEKCPMHTIWVLRAKFEKLKYNCKTNLKNTNLNFSLFQEIKNTITFLLEHFKDTEEEISIKNISKEVNRFFNDYTYTLGKIMPKR